MNLYNSKIYIEDLHTAIKSSINIQNIKNRSILITGASGTIGSFIVDMLMLYNKIFDANVTVYAVGRSRKKLAARFDSVKTENLLYVEYDIMSPAKFAFDVDYIIHAGGNAHPAAFHSDPVGTIMGNINGTYNLLEYARIHGVKRLLYISSGEIYGQGDIGLDSFDEEYCGYLNITSPRSCYPVSKRAAETLCVSYSKQYGLDTVIVRPCHTYGPGITEEDNRANVQFIRNVLNDENITLKSSGTQMRSYCYIADCAAAVFTVLLNGKCTEAYNSANPDSRITIAELAEIIADYAGKKVVYTDPDAFDLENRSPIAKQVLSSSKTEALGWKGQFTLEKGITHTLLILKSDIK